MTFESAYELYWPVAVRVAGRAVRRREDAEDVAAEAMLKVLRNWRGDGPEHPVGYIMTAVRHAALDRADRSRRIRIECLETAEDLGAALVASDAECVWDDAPAGAAEHAETIREVVAALGRLSPRYRAVFWACQVEGRSYAEVAALIGTTEATIKVTLTRARRQFARAWAGESVRKIPTRTRPRTNPANSDRRRAQWRDAKRRKKQREAA